MIAQLAQAVVDALNAGEYGRSFSARRYYLPKFDLEELDELHLSVVPRRYAIGEHSRGKNLYSPVIDIGIQQRIQVDSLEERDGQVDELVALAEGIAADFRPGRRVEEFSDAVVSGVVHDPVYDLESLEERQLFTSIVSVTFQLTG